ncbi:MAG: tRNA pseudouridine(55) synthase TruB [Clostridia bacterium]|nr:tRNA pseudouridine(55) synthase TruB [Clostridia bacterium]
MYNGLIILDKPADFTSHDAVAKTRGILRQRRIGHAGTLDPLATGVLILLLGSATRASELASGHDKEYIAALRPGLATDTQDISGREISREAREVSADELRAVLPRFCGKISQVPPMYSAVQVEGKRLYQLARAGKNVERAARSITIHELELLEGRSPEGDFFLRVLCSKGTYVRTLCHDIGAALGCGGCLASLRRTRSGSFGLERAVTFDTLAEASRRGELAELIIPTDELFSEYPAISVTPDGAARVKNGAFVAAGQISSGSIPAIGGLCRVYAPDGDFLMLGRSGELERGGEAVFGYKNFWSVE